MTSAEQPPPSGRGLRDETGMASEWFNLGVIYRQLAKNGDKDALQQATESFSKASQLAPKDAFSWFALGQSHLDSGNYVTAESTLQLALTVFRDNNISQGDELALAYASHGLALLRMGSNETPPVPMLMRSNNSKKPKV